MPRLLRPPSLETFRRKRPITLSPAQRTEILASMRDLSPREPDRFAAIEHVLNQYPSVQYLYAISKPAHERDAAIGILRMLRRGRMPKGFDWWLRASLKLCGCKFGADGQPIDIESLRAAATRLRDDAARYASPRRPPMAARDQNLIPDVCEIFARWVGEKFLFPADRDDEYIDALERFVAVVLKAGNIPCPRVRDTSGGEQNQGKLRRLLKTMAKKRGRNLTRQAADS